MSCISVHSSGARCGLPATHTLEGLGYHLGGGLKWAAGGAVTKTEAQLTIKDVGHAEPEPNRIIVHPDDVGVVHDHYGEIVGYVVTLR